MNVDLALLVVHQNPDGSMQQVVLLNFCSREDRYVVALAEERMGVSVICGKAQSAAVELKGFLACMLMTVSISDDPFSFALRCTAPLS